MLDPLVQLVLSLVQNHPLFGTVMVVVGVARLLFKPAFGLLKDAAAMTPSLKDDAVMAKIMSSKVYAVVSFVLDYSLSIKLPSVEPKA